MGLEMVKGVLVLKMDMISTTALAGLLLVMGYFLRSKVSFFERFCIPAPVIGGFAFAILAWIFKETGIVNFNFTTTLQSPFMIAFFTTVGIGGSLGLMKKGGKALFVYLFFCWFIAVFQNAFGSALASAFGIHPVLGVMAGAVSLEGGHGAAAAFGPTAEALGVKGATAVAIASATYGLISGSLLGGPVAKWLIEKNNVEVKSSQEHFESFDEVTGSAQEEKIESKGLLRMMALVLVIMTIGAMVSGKLKAATGFDLPGYVGAMIIAVIFRNLNDQTKTINLNTKDINLMADVSIGMFLTMAMMTLRIWDLYDLALPLISILVLQTIALLFLAVFVLFRLLGKDYDAAVICAGLMGHGLGATPNAVANMGSVCEHYKVMSYKAFLIVPLCGAVLIDLVGLPCIVWFINHFAG
jgi:ESS family glutamate:Na+ symporter